MAECKCKYQEGYIAGLNAASGLLQIEIERLEETALASSDEILINRCGTKVATISRSQATINDFANQRPEGGTS